MESLSIRTKLLAIFSMTLAIVFVNIFIFSAFINKNNTILKETIYEQALESTQLILNADRDFYQAYNMLEELKYNENINRNASIKDYSENAKQVLERTSQAKEILTRSKANWEQYNNKETGKNIFDEFDTFFANYDKWKNSADALIINKGNFANQSLAFDNARQPLDSITNILDNGAKEKIQEIEQQTQNSIIIMLLISLSLASILYTYAFSLINRIIGGLSNIISNLTNNASDMHQSSEQLSEASNSLASGSVEQAAAIQETSATIEETSSMVQQNNENTKQAATMAKNAKAYAMKSNDEMNSMMQSMNDLKLSSNEIAKIIKVIDEIAFQTNILSLNAAVEAARAGDAGKGFAVVAEEVRNLAQRSAQAAKDTASIIEKNISLSDNSVVVAKKVNEALEQIDTEARKVSELLEEISIATEEQSRGINEINKAIQQMEQVMQINSVAAEESSSASNSVADQAANINAIIKELIQLINGAQTAHVNYSASNSSVSTNKSSIASINTTAKQTNYKMPVQIPAPVTNKGELISWNDSFSVGIVEMDNQHKQLVAILNDLYALLQSKSSSDELGKVLSRLVSYTKKHFADEEEFIKKHSYPDVSSQIREHKAFVDKIQNFKNDYDSGKTTISVSITSFLKDWLMNHISISDKKYGDYINNSSKISAESVIPLGNDF